MRILHYFLGFPPYRTGGLTKYAFDLMQAQVADGHAVMALWPGQMGFAMKQTAIRRRRSVAGIESFELINPLPVPLDEGIAETDAYTASCGSGVYGRFLEKCRLDAIHVHTLMGLHREFIDAAGKLGIRTVFTSHDYFGICPKVTLYRYGEVCGDDHGCRDCIQCCCHALSMNKIRIVQSPLYRAVKNSAVVRQFRKRHRSGFFAEETMPEMPLPEGEIPAMAEKYAALREYYIGMLSGMDRIHFNSALTERVYGRYFTPKDSRVMTITHRTIADHRTAGEWKPGDRLRLTCLAPAKPFKGFNVLREALDSLWAEGKRDFELKLFGPVAEPAAYMKVRGEGFTHDQLKEIMADTDVLVAPSVWYETFGFTVLEALSFGVPVIVSDHVGARDVTGGAGIVVEAGSAQALKDAVLSLTAERLSELREAARRDVQIKIWQDFVRENYGLYR